MLLGDFNFVEVPQRDRANSESFGVTQQILTQFQKATTHLNDCAELCGEFKMTYRDLSRIDRVYIGNTFTCKRLFVLNNLLSKDHNLLFFEINQPQLKYQQMKVKPF